MAEKYEEIASDLIGGNAQHCIVEASAGTGKTYTIEHLVVELVKSSSSFIDLNQLMLVTFTDKAAGELRGRILKTLKEATEDESLSPAQRKKIQRSVDAIDSAQISTFHAFCQKMMSTYAYDANLPFSFDLVNKKSMEILVDKACRDEWVKGEFADLVKLGADAEKLTNLVKSILKMYNEDTTEFPVFESDPCYEKCKQVYGDAALREIAYVSRSESSAYKENIAQLDKLIAELEPFKDESYNISKRSDLPVSKVIEGLDGWREKTKNLVKVNDQWYREFVAAHEEFYNIEKRIGDIRAFFDAIPAKTNLTKLQKSLERLFALREAKKIYEDWKRRKHENKEKTFDDLISEVYHELRQEKSLLKETLQNKFKMVIIDEFQDTNAVQWGIFETLFLNDKNHILVVGDPKQSIYSFQGGDVEIYRKAKKQIEEFQIQGQVKGKLYTLEANYRSSKEMIKACNALFCGKFDISPDKDELCLFGDKNQSFIPATAGEPNENVASIDGDEVYKPFWLSSAKDERGYADFCVERLAEIFSVDANGKTNMQVKGRNLKFSDVAVLVRKSKEYAVIEEKFSAAGIPFLRYKDTTLFEGRECAHWEWILRAIDTPNDSREFQGALRAALLTDFFKPFLAKETSERFKQIEKYSFETMSYEGKKSLLTMFSIWRRYAAKKRWTALVESIYKETGVEQYLSKPADMGHLARVRQVGDYVQECLLSEAYTLSSLAQHLRQLNTSGSDSNSAEDDMSTVAKGSDLDAVQLMTMHSSKGLEFPIVIMFGGFTGANTKVSVSLGNLSGDKRKIEFGYKSESIEEAESRRLFYVAYTRAQFLVLTWLTDNCSEGAPIKTFVKSALEGTDFKKCVKQNFEHIPNVVSAISQSVKALSKTTDKAKVGLDVDKKLEDLQLSSRTTRQKAYSSITHHKHISDAEVKAVSQNQAVLVQQEDIHDPAAEEAGCGDDYEFSILNTKLPRGSHFGNALHKIFELTDFSKVDEDFLSSGEFLNLMKNSFGEEHLKFDDVNHGEALRKVVYNVLHEPIADRNGETFMLADLKQNQTRREMLFQFSDPVAPNVIIKGFIDLLFARGEGDKRRFYILDWKSDGLEVYNDDRMILQVEAREYSVQKVLYTYYLIRWLKTFSDFPQSEEEIFENHFGGIYYVFARGAENDEKSILSHTFEAPCDSQEASKKFDFWDYASLKRAFDRIMIERVNIGGSSEE